MNTPNPVDQPQQQPAASSAGTVARARSHPRRSRKIKILNLCGRLALLILLILGGAPDGLCVDLVTLAPGNYSEFVPKGKEVDAIFGDYVLRNDKIVVVVADPTLQMGRSASRKMTPFLQARIIDLTLRNSPNDLLGAFDPISALRPQGVQHDAPMRRSELRDEAETAKQPGRSPTSGPQQTLTFQCSDPRAFREAGYRDLKVELQYTLADGWPYVLAVVTCKNNGSKPLPISTGSALFMSVRPWSKNNDFVHGSDSANGFTWMSDPWFGQAYGILAERYHVDLNESLREPGQFGAGSLSLRYRMAADKRGAGVTLAPGQSWSITQRIFPGRDLSQVRAIANQLLNIQQKPVPIIVKDADGPVADVEVQTLRDGTLYAAGRTGADGILAIELPPGRYEFQAKAIGRERKTGPVDVATATEVKIDLEKAASVAAEITDDQGGPIPCKVEFRGQNGIPDPFFFTDMGEHLVRNLVYTETGKFRQALPPGKYDVIVTRGPEYDAIFQSIEAVRGQETKLTAKLTRSVDTTGWISAEFGNRSTLSRPYSTASPLGRVLNLLGEQIEFAPSTERSFIATFEPHLRALGAERWLATCPGIGLDLTPHKSWTHQTAFPVIPKPGAQDGGAPQRVQHELQVWWLSGWYGDPKSEGWTAGTEKLVQVTPPEMWEWGDGMWYMFDDHRVDVEDVQRGARLVEASYYNAMELQPLDPFLHLSAYDPADPKGEKDIAAWWKNLEERRSQKKPDVKDRNLDWIRMLNLGYRITGTVNSNPYYNFHGSGQYRNYVRCSTDDPAKINPLDVVRAVKHGHLIMTTGPFLDVKLQGEKGTAGIPGDDLSVPGGKAILHVRVQCANWIDTDRVQVLFNGHPVSALTFARSTHPDQFGKGVVKFDQQIPLQLAQDTHVMVLVTGQGQNLRLRKEGDGGKMTHIALSNPIYVDVDGNGFKPHSPVLDKVFAKLELVKPLSSGPGNGPARVRLLLKNLADVPATDDFSVEFRPPSDNSSGPPAIVRTGSDASVVGENRFPYTIKPGEQTAIEFDVALTKDSTAKEIRIHIPRSSRGVGRRVAGLNIVVDKEPVPGKEMWLPEHAKDRPPEWGRTLDR